ncbi:MAG TPA: pentapeptide repeat-containing protein, partial [Thermoanaerobaculia bacterium]|nr:pentapeptide repeat-containing protein [Thermoanaerobaculia bacterium]
MSETLPPDDPERAARLAKLQLETALLERQLSPRFEALERRKATAALAGFAAAIIAGTGLILSSSQWFITSRRTAQAELNDRVAHYLDQLASPSVPARLNAVASLTSLVTEADARKPQMLRAFVNDLAIEDSPLVRSSLLSALQQPTTRTILKPELDSLLDAALTMNRALVVEGRLIDTRRRNSYEQPLSPAEYRAQSMAQAIRILLVHGAASRNFSQTYLWGADFRKLDLTNVNFDRAILSWAVFDGANVKGASFNDAFLDGTSFVAAQAAFSHFDQVVKSGPVPREAFTSYS